MKHLNSLACVLLLTMAIGGVALGQSIPINVDGSSGSSSCTSSFCTATAPLSGLLGGTGVANTGKTITLSASFVTLGSGTPSLSFPAGAFTYTYPGATGTLVDLASAQTLTNKSIATTQLTGALQAAQFPALTGDITTSAGALATTLATVNSNVGTFGDTTHCANFTVNGKGLITAAAQSTSCPGAGGGAVSITSLSNNLVVAPSPITGTGTIAVTYLIDAQTGTTDTIDTTNLGKLTTYSNAASVAVTVPQATGSYAAGASFDVQNKGAGVVTFTPTISTVNGAASIALAQNQGCSFVSDGTNWQVTACTAIGVAASGTVNSGTAGQVAYYAGTGTAVSGSALGTGVLTAMGTNLSAAGGLTTTISSGTSALGTAAIGSAACASVVTTAATNVATTDVIQAGFNGDPTGVTGYAPLVAGMLTIISYPSANNVNFKVCNNTSSSITPGAITLNWRVAR